MLASLLSVSLAAPGLAGAAEANAAPTPTPTSKEDAEEARLNALLVRFDGRRDSIESRLRVIESDLIEIELKLARLRAALARAEAELARRRAELIAAIRRLAAQRALLRESVSDIYIRGPFSRIDAFLNAEDFSSLISVDVYSEAVLNDFIVILHKIEREKERVARLHAAVRERTLELRRRTAEVEKEEARILRLQQEAFASRQRLIANLIKSVGGLATLRAHGFELILRSYSGASTRIANLLRTAQQGQDVAREGEYLLRWPIRGAITSRFGWRIHPIFHYRSFHTGIDIRGDYGQPVETSRAGKVLAAGYMGAYGLAVVIDHGHSIGTVYAHLARTRVRAGQRVEDRDVIGEVGCSGWCTGSHLHFEVIVAGKPRNPLFWL